MTHTSHVTLTTEPPGKTNRMLNLSSLHPSILKHILAAYFIYCVSTLVNLHINMTKVIYCTNYCSSTDARDTVPITVLIILSLLLLLVIIAIIYFYLYTISYHNRLICNK